VAIRANRNQIVEVGEPTLLLRLCCASGENREALWAMIAPRDRDAVLH
jgi:hypothetical protein